MLEHVITCDVSKPLAQVQLETDDAIAFTRCIQQLLVESTRTAAKHLLAVECAVHDFLVREAQDAVRSLRAQDNADGIEAAWEAQATWLCPHSRNDQPLRGVETLSCTNATADRTDNRKD